MQPISDYEVQPKAKPVVKFDKRKSCYIVKLANGTSIANLFPMNHPDSTHVSNTKLVFTSAVKNFVEKDGRIVQVETENTIYVESDE